MKALPRLLIALLIVLLSFSSLTGAAASVQSQGDAAQSVNKTYLPLALRAATFYQVSGQVLDGDSYPLAGVSITDKDGHTTTTNASGYYSLYVEGGQNALAASKDGYLFSPTVLELTVNSNMAGQNFSLLLACQQGVLDGSFEIGGWWALNNATIVNAPPVPHFGVWSAQLGILPPNPPAVLQSYIFTPAIAVPPAMLDTNLSLWVKRGTTALPNNPADLDTLWVVVWDAAAMAPVAVRNLDRVNDATWQEVKIPLGNVSGMQLIIQIGVTNDAVGGVTWMNVDDVSLAMCDQPPTVPVCTQQFINPNFNFPGLGWGVVGSTYPATFVSSYAHSAPYSMRAGIPLESSDNVPSWSEFYQIVNVPAGIAYAGLNVWLYPQSEEPWTPSFKTGPPNLEGFEREAPTGPDIQWISITDPAGILVYQDLLWEQASHNHQWINRQYDLSAYAGMQIRVNFSVFNDGWNGRTVMYVDDAYLVTCTGTPQPPLPSNIINNGGFETNSGWYIPATAYSAGYSTVIKRTGSRSMRTGILFPAQDTPSNSYFGQLISIPLLANQAQLSFWRYTSGGDPGDVQYLIARDITGLWTDVLWWRNPSANQPFWVQETINMNAYIGELFYLEWGTINDGDGNVSSMYVDDVELWVGP